MTLDDLMKHHDEDMALYSAVSQYTDVMDRVRFGQFCCIIMELYCKFNDEDVVQYSQWIADNIRTLNGIMGRF